MKLTRVGVALAGLVVVIVFAVDGTHAARSRNRALEGEGDSISAVSHAEAPSSNASRLVRLRRKRLRSAPGNAIRPQPQPQRGQNVAASETAEGLLRSSPPQEEKVGNKTKDDARFFSLFTVVRFNNDACESSTGTNGTCYSSADCSRLGGRSSGACASGFGVCCIFSISCGQSSSINCTYFQSTGYPSTFNSVGACQGTINKAANVCELRLDFENFNLAGPETTDNTCNRDQFVITGGQPIPALCGVNSGQHIYVDTGAAASPIVMSALTVGSSNARSFAVKVTQIPCSAVNQAPSGCLQWYTGVSGQITTFNYQSANGLQLSNTDYTICVRMEQNFCGITYTACPDPAHTPSMAFSITGGTPAQGSVVGTNCITDWIIIPCATNTNSPTAQNGTPTVCVDRICGMVFNSVTTAAGTSSVPVTSNVKPFTITVHTNSVEASGTPADTTNRGFCLNYVENPCTSTSG